MIFVEIKLYYVGKRRGEADVKTYEIDTYLRRKDALPIWSEHIASRIRREPEHMHNCMEIMYIRSGAACCKVNRCLYPVTRGDFYVFAPGDVHAFSISGGLSFDNLLFSMELFSEAELKKLPSKPRSIYYAR